MQAKPMLRFTLVAAAGAALVAGAALPAAGQDPPPPPGPAGTGQPKGPDPIKIGSGQNKDAPPPEKAPPPELPAMSEPEQLVAQLATWPSQEAKQASVRLAAQPRVAYPLLERKMLESGQDWRVVCGVAATLSRIGDLKAMELIEAKVQDRRMWQHSPDLLDAIVRLDPVGAKARLLALLVHPASAVVHGAAERLEERVSPVDLDALRDVFDAADPSGRAAAVALLQKADATAIRPDLVKALRDPAPEVALAAARAIAADDAEEARTLALNALTSPLDRQVAYGAIALALRAERVGGRVLDDPSIRTLLGGRGLRHLDLLPRGAAAIALADEAYRHEVPVLEEALDTQVVPVLVETVASTVFWQDMKSLQPLALRRLQRLTGLYEMRQPQQWAAWWDQNRSGFRARRVLLEIAPDTTSTLAVTVAGEMAPGGESTTVGASADAIAGGAADELTLLLTPEDATALAEAIQQSGVLRLPESASGGGEGSGDLMLSIRAGRRERRFSLRGDALPAEAAEVLRRIEDLRTRLAWQRYRTSSNSVDLESFVALMGDRFDPSRTDEERAASLAALIAQALDDRRGDAWNVRALRDLEAIPQLGTALGPTETDRLLQVLGRRNSLDAMAEGIVRVLSRARRQEALPLLVEFLTTRGGARGGEMLVDVFRAAPPSDVVAAAADERDTVRAAALASLTPNSLGGGEAALATRALKDLSQLVRAEAVRTLGRLRVEDARADLEALAAAPGELRLAAVEALGLLGGKSSLSSLMTAYAHPETSVRVAAVRALAATREPESLSALVFAMSGDPAGVVREVASQLLVEIGTDRAAAELRKRAVDRAHAGGPRARAVAGFAALRGPAALQDLARLLDAPGVEVADEAAHAKARWRDPAAVPHLLEMLEKDRATTRARQALESISLESFRQGDPAILANLYAGWWEVSRERGPRGWLVDALTLSGIDDPALLAWGTGGDGRAVVPLLLQGVRHDAWYVRRASDLALREILGRSVGDQEPWTTAGEAARLAQAWEREWASMLSR